MTLDEYITKNGLVGRFLAKKLGVNENQFGAWRRGIIIPRPHRIAQIIELTDGQVTAQDFYDGFMARKKRDEGKGAA